MADPINISANYWVTISYELTSAQGEPVEKADEPIRYLHGGYGVLFEKLEAALEGKSVGDEVKVYVEPEDHFGEYDAHLVHLSNLAMFDEAPVLDQVIEGLPHEPDDGRSYRVTELVGETVLLDGNHPLAGIGLWFDLTVLAIELATEDEIAAQRAASSVDDSWRPNDETDVF